jgi:cell division septation protein DedD
LRRVTVRVVVASGYSDTGSTDYPSVSTSAQIAANYPQKIYIVYTSNEIFYGEFNFWAFYSVGTAPTSAPTVAPTVAPTTAKPTTATNTTVPTTKPTTTTAPTTTPAPTQTPTANPTATGTPTGTPT